MANLQNALPPKIFEILEKSCLSIPKQIFTLSISDLKRRTNLAEEDLLLLKNIAANYYSPKCVKCSKLLELRDLQKLKTSIGCSALDDFLEGGLRKGTLTEIYGESGSGKTQLGIQVAVNNWDKGCVYICTEDLFPVKRFEQFKQNVHNYCPDTDYGKNIFIEHITEANELLSCVKVRLPNLLKKVSVSILIIDSVAAPYRCDTNNYMQRAEELKELGIWLIKIAQEYNLAVLCINQVTASFDGTKNVLPSLGLSWSNMISTRLMLRKTKETYNLDNKKSTDSDMLSYKVRELSIIFSPELPISFANFIINTNGIQAIKSWSNT